MRLVKGRGQNPLPSPAGLWVPRLQRYCSDKRVGQKGFSSLNLPVAPGVVWRGILASKEVGDTGRTLLSSPGSTNVLRSGITSYTVTMGCTFLSISSALKASGAEKIIINGSSR